MTKDRLIEIVEHRIKTEFKKYGNDPEMNWEHIAARKIVSNFLYVVENGGVEISPRSKNPEGPVDPKE